MSACDALAELECSCRNSLNPESAPTEKQRKPPHFLPTKRLFHVPCSSVFERTMGVDTYMVVNKRRCINQALSTWAYPESCGSDPAEGGHQGSAKGQPNARVGRRHLQPLCGGSHVRTGHLAHAELKAPAHRTDFTTKIEEHPQEHFITCHTSLQVHWAGACDHAGLRAPALSCTGLSLGIDKMHSVTFFEGRALLVRAVHDAGNICCTTVLVMCGKEAC